MGCGELPSNRHLYQSIDLLKCTSLWERDGVTNTPVNLTVEFLQCVKPHPACVERLASHKSVIASPTGPQGARCGEVTLAPQRQVQGSLRKAWKRWSREPTEPHGAACYYECTGGPWNASPGLWNSDIRCKTATANRSLCGWLSKCMSIGRIYYVSSLPCLLPTLPLTSCPQKAMSRKWI